MKVELTIWLHSHVDDPGVPHSFDIWNVTGEQVPMAYLDFLRETNEDETPYICGELETEQAYRVRVHVDEYEDHYESYTVSSEKLDMEQEEQ